MSKKQQPIALELRLAALLSVGTWLSSAVIAAGLLIPARLPAGPAVLMTGVTLLIALPVLRVLVMLQAYARARDPLWAVTGLILLVIATSVAAGLVGRD